MKKKTIYQVIASATLALTLGSCNDFLDTMPDNRAEVDTEEKIIALVGSAYPDHDYNMITEMMSDNVDDMSETSAYTSRFAEQLYHWEDVEETNNESPERFWASSYIAIASANLAIESAEKLAAEKGWTANLRAVRAEALMCRAYNHFMLLNLFAKNYNSKTAATDPGITFMTKPETKLNPKYDRQTVAQCYELIEKDIEEALPNISDSYMKAAPKYHFNPSAAYAFACRFYLYYEKWEKAIECADHVLGSSPLSILRNYKELGSITQTPAAVTQLYVDSKLNCNLLMTTGYSYCGTVFLNYSTWKRFTHSPYLGINEDAEAKHPWGTATYWSPMKHYSGSNNYYIFWRMPNFFEYTDPVAGTGYRHCVFVNFTTDEVLLNRAEAYILTKQYDKACADINLWLNNIASTKTGKNITPQSVQEFYNSTPYWTWDQSTTKKHLHPAFEIDAEGSVQESMLQCLLNARRIEQLHTGMRWFDVKRYGIEIVRRVMDAGGDPVKLKDELKVDDPRRAIQIPLKVRTAGYEANPRNTVTKESESIHDLPKEDPEDVLIKKW